MKEQIFSMYEELNIGKCSVCQSCATTNGNNLSKPLSPWLIGSKFVEDKHKILFVGKVARGNDLENIQSDLFIDGTYLGNNLMQTSEWAFWSYTREIIRNVYGSLEQGIDRVAVTNLIKCNNSATIDKTNFATKENCIEKLQVIWKEIELLQPKKVIFYTHNDYDKFILDYKPEKYSVKYIENAWIQSKIQIGAKQMPWWHIIFSDKDDNKAMEFLRVGHPERLKKEEFIKKISEWILSD